MLTLNQEFEFEMIKRSLDNITIVNKEELIELTKQLLKQSLVFKIAGNCIDRGVAIKLPVNEEFEMMKTFSIIETMKLDELKDYCLNLTKERYCNYNDSFGKYSKN